MRTQSAPESPKTADGAKIIYVLKNGRRRATDLDCLPNSPSAGKIEIDPNVFAPAYPTDDGMTSEDGDKMKQNAACIAVAILFFCAFVFLLLSVFFGSGTSAAFMGDSNAIARRNRCNSQHHFVNGASSQSSDIRLKLDATSFGFVANDVSSISFTIHGKCVRNKSACDLQIAFEVNVETPVIFSGADGNGLVIVDWPIRMHIVNDARQGDATVSWMAASGSNDVLATWHLGQAFATNVDLFLLLLVGESSARVDDVILSSGCDQMIS